MACHNLGSPVIDGIFLVQKMCIYSSVMIITTFNCIDYTQCSSMAWSACDASCLHHDASQADPIIELDRA